MLINLLSNAEKYSPRKKEIEVEVSRSGSEAAAHVRDRGIGVAEKDRERIFHEFVRVDDSLSARVPGTGLGLTIARRIARDHGGDLSCSGREEGGSDFALTASRGPGGGTMKQRILVAEDDAAILTGLVDLLEGEGFAVETAGDGAAAIARWNEARPDLILLDVMMPEKNGFDVCREVRRRDSLTPVIMLTAKGEEIDKVVGLELGADDYVVKPFGANELLARIRAVLRRGRGERFRL